MYIYSLQCKEENVSNRVGLHNVMFWMEIMCNTENSHGKLPNQCPLRFNPLTWSTVFG